MEPKNNLFLHEEILLLALKDEEGTIASGARYNFAVGGAILAELLLGLRIAVDPSKTKRVSVIDPEPLGDPLIDEWLMKIAAAKRPKPLQHWVCRIAETRGLHHRIALPLCQRGILKVEEKAVLLLFTKIIYPQISPQPERQILDRLQKAVFTDTEDIDARTIVLLSLANSANLLPALFGKKPVKERKARIDRIVNGEIAGTATRQAIQAVDSALMIACIIPVIAAS
jgi:golgi phosphoprotein 3